MYLSCPCIISYKSNKLFTRLCPPSQSLFNIKGLISVNNKTTIECSKHIDAFAYF